MEARLLLKESGTARFIVEVQMSNRADPLPESGEVMS